MQTSNNDELIGRTITKDLGVVSGRATWRKPFLYDLLSGYRLLMGTADDAPENEALVAARAEARRLCIDAARDKGANGLVSCHYMLVRLSLTTVEVRHLGRAVITVSATDADLTAPSRKAT